MIFYNNQIFIYTAFKREKRNKETFFFPIIIYKNLEILIFETLKSFRENEKSYS